jgi:hypothetical protein
MVIIKLDKIEWEYTAQLTPNLNRNLIFREQSNVILNYDECNLLCWIFQRQGNYAIKHTVTLVNDREIVTLRFPRAGRAQCSLHKARTVQQAARAPGF